MPWLNDWVVHVAHRQKQTFQDEDYDVLRDRNISKQEHLFLINRLSNQLTSISEILSYFGCADAAQKVDEAIDEMTKIQKSEMPSIRRKKKNAVKQGASVQAESGAKILELHES